MNKKPFVLAFALALAFGYFAWPAHAEEFTCIGSVGSITVDNLRVPQGATCTLHGTYVKGTIKVETNATLYAHNVRVIGNVQAENSALVEVLSGSMVGGSIQIKQGDAARIDSVRIDSDLQFDENGLSLIANGNVIGGNLQAFKNTGGLSIIGNTIDGNLQCKENQPAPTGGNNIVRGNKEDQCANLRSETNPPPVNQPPRVEEDLLGTYETYGKAKLKIRRLGGRSSTTDSTMVLNQSRSFDFTETAPAGTYTYRYTGRWNLIDGKMLSFVLDDAGRTEFMQMLVDWVEELAVEKNISINSISFSELQLSISQNKIPKNAIVPRKFLIKAQGLMNATVNGQNRIERFSYKGNVFFRES